MAAAALIAVISLFWCFQKQGMFVDELYSYGLSNSYYAPFITRISEDGIIDQTLTHNDLLDYVVADESDKFSYGSVYYNQTQDVHPPLFYFMLHTVCSLFPGSFSKWTGLGLNLLLFAATLISLYQLANIMYNGKWQTALLVCVLYAISVSGISTMLMIRMYMLMTLLAVFLSYLIVRQMQRPFRLFCLFTALIIFMGMMTQHLFAVYAFFVCLAYDIVLAYKRQWKQAFSFSVSSLGGVGAMLVVFPYWNTQLYSQETVSLDTAAKNVANLSHYLYRAVKMAIPAAKQTTSVTVLFAIGLAGIVVMLKKGELERLKKTFSSEIMVIGIPAIIAFFVIAVIAPYLDARYEYYIIPMISVLAGWLWVETENLFGNRNTTIAAGLIAFELLLIRRSNEFIGRVHCCTSRGTRRQQTAE